MMDKYFNYKKHGTNFETEVRAGVTTFLTMAYILALQPMRHPMDLLVMLCFRQG